MSKNKLLLLLVLLVAVATGAVAQTTINVTADDKGKTVCTDGSIYAKVSDVPTGKTAAAKIICLDTQNSKALALSLDNQAVAPSTVDYAMAQSKCEELNTTLAVTFGTWVLPSKAQWDAMIEAAGGYKKLNDFFGIMSGGVKMQSVTYWSSTAGTTGHWGFNLNDGDWSDVTYNSSARACLVINLPQTYSVTLAEGTEDFDKWTIEPTEATAGSPVTATYKGEKKVKSVKAVKVASSTDLATITADYEVKDGETLTGTLASNVKISIADGATVTLDNVTISGVDDGNYMWAGLNCLGDATIILKDGTKNKITGFHNHFPAIYIPGDRHNPENNKTLIIKGGEQGTGKLIARNNGEAAAIGGVKSDVDLNQLEMSAGNIEIQGGVIEAYAGRSCAAIGAAASDTCGYIRITGGTILADGGNRGVGIGCGTGMNESSGEAHCGDITITGGKIEAYGTGGAAIGSCSEGVCGNITISGGIVMATGNGWGCPGIGSGYKEMYATGCGDILIDGGAVQAYGGSSAPGIGSGGSSDQSGTCRNITITSGVTKLYAEKGQGAINSIGPADSDGKCGTVTIGGEVYWQNGSYVGEGSDYLQQNPIRYEPTN